MNKKDYFHKVFKAAERHYRDSVKRLAGDDWPKDWQTLMATIMSAQTRDEVTLPVAEHLFKKYVRLEDLASAQVLEVQRIIKPVNFSPKKARYLVASARILVEKYGGAVPNTLDLLVQLPGVGRKTANLVLSELHNHEGICVDTHVHRISNVLGFVKTKTPVQTEFALMKLAPRSYWSKINRIFVLWGKDVPGRSKRRLLDHIKM